jgi:hypothetical protein
MCNNSGDDMKEIVIFVLGAIAGGGISFVLFCAMIINRYNK